MTSPQQFEANRKNALKSTGAKTVNGKQNSSKNATKHGILSNQLIIREESVEQLNTLVDEMHDSLNPRGSLEEILVEKIITILWRLKRVLSAESEALKEKDWLGNPEDLYKKYNSNTMTAISRYEAELEKAFYKTLHELQRLQGMR